MALLKLLLFMCGFLLSAEASYLPEFNSDCYRSGSGDGNCQETVVTYVNRLVSTDSLISYDYNTFGFCPAVKLNDSTSDWNNFGQILFGDRIYLSPYQFQFNHNESCTVVCSKSLLGEKLEFMKKAMNMSYEHQWIIDNLPVSRCYNTVDGQEYCSKSFPIGCLVSEGGIPKYSCNIDARFHMPNTFYLFNHVDIVIRYHGDREVARIVKVTVEPQSYKSDCIGEPMAISDNAKQANLTYTYSVKFIHDPALEWESRWDYVLKESTQNYKIWWFSIVNSILIITFLYAFVFIISARKGIIFSCANTDIGAKQWTMLRYDVFRPPKATKVFCANAAVGVQILSMMFGVLILGSIRLLSPSHYGSLATALIALFISSSLLSGFTSVKLFQGFGGHNWKTNALITSLLISTIVFGIYFTLNIVVWKAGGSVATPGFILFKVVVTWIGFSVPLTILGGYIYRLLKPGARQVATFANIPRRVPKQPLRSRTLPAIIAGGILPFGTIFNELSFILHSIWLYQIYNAFGFLLINTLLLAVSCAGVSIILCYLQLMNEDYRWHWRAFLSSGATAFYFYIYTIYFYIAKFQIKGNISAIIYVGYSLIMAIFMFLLCGSVGYFSSSWFITKLYRSLENGGEKFELTETPSDDKHLKSVALEPCLASNKRPEEGVVTNGCDVTAPDS